MRAPEGANPRFQAAFDELPALSGSLVAARAGPPRKIARQGFKGGPQSADKSFSVIVLAD
jgi:hypothetical protein